MNTEFEKELAEILDYKTAFGAMHPTDLSNLKAITKAHNQHLRTVLERLKTNREPFDVPREDFYIPESVVDAEIAKLKEGK